MRIEARRSSDGRLRTERYERGGRAVFGLAERTRDGTLLTEFYTNGDVADQLCEAGKAPEAALAALLSGVGALGVVDGAAYERVEVRAKCGKCGGKVARELDLRRPELIAKVPVVPMFVCVRCGTRHYSLSEGYLAKLIGRNPGLFGDDELREREAAGAAFVSTVRENVIRIFASKKIRRLRMGD